MILEVLIICPMGLYWDLPMYAAPQSTRISYINPDAFEWKFASTDASLTEAPCRRIVLGSVRLASWNMQLPWLDSVPAGSQSLRKNYPTMFAWERTTCGACPTVKLVEQVCLDWKDKACNGFEWVDSVWKDSWIHFKPLVKCPNCSSQFWWFCLWAYQVMWHRLSQGPTGRSHSKHQRQIQRPHKRGCVWNLKPCR